MSILLSAYYPDGIVFAADKNASIEYETLQGEKRWHVEPTATKVLAWPNRRAVVGFVGLGTLAEYDMDEWMRIFIAETRNFKDIDQLATELKDRIQNDFDKDYPKAADISECHLIIHLGGFALRDGYPTPVLYHIWNHDTINPSDGTYPVADKNFRSQEEVEQYFKAQSILQDYPLRVRDRLAQMVKKGDYLWFNNGANIAAFNVFKAVIWAALDTQFKMLALPRSFLA